MSRKPDPKRVARRHLAVLRSDPMYPKAGRNAQPEVQEALKRWRELPLDVKVQGPLWHWLLGAPTPDYKLPRKAADYRDPSPRENRNSGNCRYAYKQVVSSDVICSVVRGSIDLSAWCRLWD